MWYDYRLNPGIPYWHTSHCCSIHVYVTLSLDHNVRECGRRSGSLTTVVIMVTHMYMYRQWSCIGSHTIHVWMVQISVAWLHGEVFLLGRISSVPSHTYHAWHCGTRRMCTQRNMNINISNMWVILYTVLPFHLCTHAWFLVLQRQLPCSTYGKNSIT